MDKKMKSIIGVIGSFLVCFFGLYRLLVETTSTADLLLVPIVFAVTGFIGVIGNSRNLMMLNNRSH
ncbi:hypothetical protein [Halobacillus hunanensis]|uniref:hypothetical protein n=1 Tax=Halobacillus hunanensis TaxID=578214 RepID=UPI0009A9000B|nr:hypothetical protein [Halobacillus hunanensis]